MSSLFKRAAVRGVAFELARRGAVAFPTKQAMDEAADAVADTMPELPEVSGDAGHAPESVAEIAQKLIDLANKLMAQGGEAAAPAAMELGKMAAAADLETVASDEAVSCMDKAAGSLIQGGDKGNDPGQSTKVTEIGALDQKNRPQGYAVKGQGKTELDTDAGEQLHVTSPTAPAGNSPAGSNSVTPKKASLNDELRKVANKLVGLHAPKDNTESASQDPLAKLDLKHRPEGYAHVGQGNTNFSEPQSARVGLEKKPTTSPSNSPGGSNSVTEASKLSAEDAALLTLFKKTAAEIGDQLPETLSGDEKVAAIRTMIGLSKEAREAYIGSLKKASEGAGEAQKESSLEEQFRAIASGK